MGLPALRRRPPPHPILVKPRAQSEGQLPRDGDRGLANRDRRGPMRRRLLQAREHARLGLTRLRNSRPSIIVILVIIVKRERHDRR
jgi:hypothetical protein